MNFKNKVKNGIIVSVQALEDEPLHSSFIMGRMARAVNQDGVKAIRANSIADIAEIKEQVDLPIIGIIKIQYEDFESYITPTKKEIKELIDVGVDVIAIDARDNVRSEGNDLKSLIDYSRELDPNVLLMADCQNLEEIINADKLGFDIVSTTFYGTNEISGEGNIFNDNMQPIKDIISSVNCDIIIEGHIETPEQMEMILNEFKDDILTLVVGSAITRPQIIVKKFLDKIS